MNVTQPHETMSLSQISKVKEKFLQLLYPQGIHLYTVLIRHSLPCKPQFSQGAKQMDWFYLLLIMVFYGLTVLLIYGIDKLRSTT